MSTRTLKIEERGVDYRCQRRTPMVRLKGKWLEAAGFKAGGRVQVKLLAPGVMVLREAGGAA